MRAGPGVAQVLVRALPGWEGVEADAVAFVVVGEERLLLALEAPEGTHAQPLTLAAMQVYILKSSMKGAHFCCTLRLVRVLRVKVSSLWVPKIDFVRAC